ncbi:MAG: hypothetical protein ACLUSP_04550 [Christensenellales bacterium]
MRVTWYNFEYGFIRLQNESAGINNAPLADRMRPTTIEEFIGQSISCTRVAALPRDKGG